jgi:hypothetical protein
MEPYSVNSPSAMQKIGAGLPGIVPPGEFLDMMPITLSNSLLGAVRGANCQIHARAGKKAPWWRFWRRDV